MSGGRRIRSSARFPSTPTGRSSRPTPSCPSPGRRPAARPARSVPRSPTSNGTRRCRPERCFATTGSTAGATPWTSCSTSGWRAAGCWTCRPGGRRPPGTYPTADVRLHRPHEHRRHERRRGPGARLALDRRGCRHRAPAVGTRGVGTRHRAGRGVRTSAASRRRTAASLGSTVVDLKTFGSERYPAVARVDVRLERRIHGRAARDRPGRRSVQPAEREHGAGAQPRAEHADGQPRDASPRAAGGATGTRHHLVTASCDLAIGRSCELRIT